MMMNSKIILTVLATMAAMAVSAETVSPDRDAQAMQEARVDIYEARGEFLMALRQSKDSWNARKLAELRTNEVYSTLFVRRLADWRSPRAISLAVQTYRRKCPSDTTPDDGLVSMLSSSRIEQLSEDKGHVNVIVRSPSPQQAADLANAYVAAIEDFTDEENKRRCEMAVMLIHANVEKKQRDVTCLRGKLLDLRLSERVKDAAYEIELARCEDECKVANEVLKGLLLDENTARIDAENRNEIVRAGRPAVVPNRPVLRGVRESVLKR